MFSFCYPVSLWVSAWKGGRPLAYTYTHMPSWRRLRRVRFLWLFLRSGGEKKIVAFVTRAVRSKMWGNARQGRMREGGEKRGGTCETEQPSLPRRQVCVNRGAVTVSDIFVKRRSPHRISSNLLLRAKLWQRVVVTDLTCELRLSDRKLRRQLTHENLSTLAGKHQSVSPPPFFSWHLRPEKEVFSSFLICTAVNLCYRLLKAKYLLLPHAVYRNSCISNAYGDWDIQFALSNVLISYCCYFGKCE